MAARPDSPVMGGSFGGVTVHDGVEDSRERLSWLRTNRAEIIARSGAEAFDAAWSDAEAQLERALVREPSS